MNDEVEGQKNPEAYTQAIRDLRLDTFQDKLLRTPGELGITEDDVIYFWDLAHKVTAALRHQNKENAAQILATLRAQLADFVTRNNVNKNIFRADKSRNVDAQLIAFLQAERDKIAGVETVSEAALTYFKSKPVSEPFGGVDSQLREIQSQGSTFISLLSTYFPDGEYLNSPQLRNAYRSLVDVDSVTLTDEQLVLVLSTFTFLFVEIQRKVSEEMKASINDPVAAVAFMPRLVALSKILDVWYGDAVKVDGITIDHVKRKYSELKTSIARAIQTQHANIKNALIIQGKKSTTAVLQEKKLAEPTDIDKRIQIALLTSELMSEMNMVLRNHSFSGQGFRMSPVGAGQTSTNTPAQASPAKVSPEPLVTVVGGKQEKAYLANETEDGIEEKFARHSVLFLALSFWAMALTGFGEEAERLIKVLQPLVEQAENLPSIQEFLQGLQAITDAFSSVDNPEAMTTAPQLHELSSGMENLLKGQ